MSIFGKLRHRHLERDQQAALMSATTDAVLAVDPEGAPLFYNSRFAILVGQANLVRRRLWKMFTQPEVLNAFQVALRNHQSVNVSSVPFVSSVGTQHYSVSVSPLKHENGSVYGALGIFHDVTELKRAEQMRIDFVANVSHELRSPLTSIKGYADTLLEDVKSGAKIEEGFVEAIARNADRLLVLIQDLLDLSAIESGKALQKTRVDTDEITQRVVKHLQGASDAKSQEIELILDAPDVFADPQTLEQVLVNLLDNAIKYTPSGGRITIRWTEDDSRNAVLRVTDTGPGISPEHHARLFERFYRVDKARSREIGGTGLGLAIVKHIMQRHAGSVAVESELGKGATFTCVFPPE